MNESTLAEFELWAVPLRYDLTKVAARGTENPFVDSGTWKAYEAWCAVKILNTP